MTYDTVSLTFVRSLKMSSEAFHFQYLDFRAKTQNQILLLRILNNRATSIKRTLQKAQFHIASKEGLFDVVELTDFSINLNA